MNEKPREGKSPGRRRSRRFWLLLAVAVVIIVAGVLYAAYWWLYARFFISTDDAYVHGNTVQLMAQVSGTVTAIGADSTDFVKQGQSLVELGPADAKLALDHAQAALAQTVRNVYSLYQQVAQQKAVIAQDQFTLRQDARDYHRAQRLIRQHTISQEQYQQTETKWLSAQAGLRAARSKLAELQTQTRGTTPENHPQVRLAASTVRKAWLDLERTIVPAPVSGFVARRSVQLGQDIQPGQALMAIVPLDQIWVEANFKETDLTDVRIGQPVTVTADFYGGSVHYHGRVAGLSPGTGSVFELLPPQNATGNWIKVVQRVPVRIALKPQEIRAHPLRLGLSLAARINVHDTSGAALARVPPTGAVYSTDVYRHNRARVEQLIKRIIKNNAVEGAAPKRSATDGG
ncbi:MAG TPA: HlyD family efflux transporter periplasmic adaptor subunit [Nitrococcus sp.]|nr:HlyD family efflux transporter periplasmic adaptor subunit [Nitrococcus sp.]